MMCNTQVAVTKTHSQQVFFITRTEVSSDATTSEVVTSVAIDEAAASSGACARARMLHSAPSLIDKPKSSPNSIHPARAAAVCG